MCYRVALTGNGVRHHLSAAMGYRFGTSHKFSIVLLFEGKKKKKTVMPRLDSFFPYTHHQIKTYTWILFQICDATNKVMIGLNRSLTLFKCYRIYQDTDIFPKTKMSSLFCKLLLAKGRKKEPLT